MRCLRILLAILFQVTEVVLVQDHSVILEPQTALELGVSGHLFLLDSAIPQDVRDRLRQSIGFPDITLIKLEVHLQSLIRNAIQSAQIELLNLIYFLAGHISSLLQSSTKRPMVWRGRQLTVKLQSLKNHSTTREPNFLALSHGNQGIYF